MTARLSDRMPFPGPRPFQPGEEKLFFGRDSETRELYSLTTAHRVVVLYATSGAGKTSLLNASLVPALASGGFEVLPTASVRGGISGDIQPEVIRNMYVYRILMNWSGEKPGAEELGGLSLSDFLKGSKPPTGKGSLPAARVMIFDQFEEIFTIHMERWRDRTGFFEQVRDALDDDPLLRILFAMREDYIAQLEPYSKILPMRTRFRLERLDAEGALAAITGPLAGTSRTFAPGVAEKLMESLLMMRVETESGGIVDVPGESVEAVQLQVCCETLWRHLTDDVTTITEDHLRAFGDVDRVLSKFYDDAIRAACERAGVEEERLRDWCENSLITSMGTRSTVYREQETTGGIVNACIEELENKHLIRAEYRAGAHWYELSHDRFIAPIHASNLLYLSRRMQQVRAANEEAQKYTLQAQQAWQEGRQAESLRLFEKAFSIVNTVDAIDGRESMANVYHHAEQYGREATVLTEAIRLRPDLTRLYAARGASFWYDGKFSEAIEDFTRVLETTPDSLDALSGRGQVLAESGQFEKALADLNRAIHGAEEADRLSAAAYARSGRGLAHGGLGSYEEAFQDFEESIRMVPDNAWVYFNRALTYERMDDNAKADADYRTALSQNNPPLNPWKREFATARLQPRSREAIQ